MRPIISNGYTERSNKMAETGPPIFQTPDILPESEDELLQTINAPLAPEARLKRDALLAEQSRRELTLDEQGTLADLIDAVEMANAGRWQAVVALARLRSLSVTEVTRDVPSEVRPHRQFGAGRHLLADIDIDVLLAVPIDDMFADYMPEDKE